MTRFASIVDAIGNTPVVKIRRLAPEGIDLFVKIEAFNPLGSVKDRLALGVIEDAEKSGALKPGQTVIEATSGNTGIGLAMVCAAKGYPLVVTMAESFSVERRKLMRFLGAKVVSRRRRQAGRAWSQKAIELAEKQRMVPHATVRERGERRHALANDGDGDPRRFRGPAARLLGDGFRHRRHAQRRGACPREGAARDEDRARRAGRRADGHERNEAGAAMPTDRPRRGIRRGSRIRFRAGVRTSFRSSPATRSKPATSTA